MKKRIGSLGMAVIMLLLSICSILADQVPVRAEGGPVIEFHYHRADGDYEPWSVWSWAEGQEGGDYAFTAGEEDAVAKIEVNPGVTSVGFIVRTQDWAKDVDADQFIDISEMVSGTVIVKVESGVEGYTKEYGADAVTGTKLKTARYDGEKSITVTMTGEVEGNKTKAFSIEGKEGKIDVTDVAKGDEFEYVLTIQKELDVAKSYNITFDGVTSSINMPIIYSTEEFEKEFTYTGDDLGATWSKESTTFRVWAPTTEVMTLKLYESGTPGKDDLKDTIEMTKDVNGTWIATVEGDLNGVYYTYNSTIDGITQEACDPYARTTGVNGKRAMVIDLESTNPEGWDKDSNPHAGERINDAIIYELHLRDLATDKSSGIKNIGKFLEMTETGTKTASGISTGIDHIKELGVTHVHLLPIYDFGSVDETFKFEKLYNWGYDPVNYNVPEGSYSTDPYNGEVRVKEAKQMVQAMHENGLSVVMDVVYNHVYSGNDFCINKLVPGYFSRINEDGSYSNGSGCGNDTASERSMVKKYIVDSVKYWADEYHMDGFRFDLVGLLDTETIGEIVEEVHKTHPDVIFYGEGWTMNTDVTKEGYTMATQMSSGKLPGFAFFNDNMRDGLKGNVFDTATVGFVSGERNAEDTIAKSFTAKETWCKEPQQIINYASCHDNNTLFDRLRGSRTDASEEDIIKMNNLAAAYYMMAEGVPFMQAGEEMLREKVNEDGTYNANTYNAGDEINSIKWDTLEEEKYANVLEYYKGLIAFRKAHAALRLSTSEEVDKYVTVLEELGDNIVGFNIKGGQDGESAKEMYLFFNANAEDKKVTLPQGKWSVYINGEKAGTDAIEVLNGGEVTVSAIAPLVLVKEGAAGNKNGTILLILVLVVILGGAGIFVGSRFRKQSKKKQS